MSNYTSKLVCNNCNQPIPVTEVGDISPACKNCGKNEYRAQYADEIHTMTDSASVSGNMTLPLPGWKDQWGRIIRSFNCVPGIKEPTNRFVVHEDVDDIIHFFQDCYHLKDWLWNDPISAPKVRSIIERYIDECPALSICADLANASKHLILNRKIRAGDPNIGVRRGGFAGPIDAIKADYQVEVNNRTESISVVAKNALEDWRIFLKSVGLVV